MVGADGLTLFRREKERKFGTLFAGFGERVWLRDSILERANKFNQRCTEATLLRFCLKSSRNNVVDLDWKLRMVRTISEPMLTTDLCRKRILLQLLTWSQRQVNSNAREEPKEKSILLRSVWKASG